MRIRQLLNESQLTGATEETGAFADLLTDSTVSSVDSQTATFTLNSNDTLLLDKKFNNDQGL